MTAAQLSAATKQARERLAAARKSIGTTAGSVHFEWYPYDSLANLLNLQKAFGDRYLSALDCAPGKTIADIGCGDGDISFFLESLGCSVDAIDFPDSNHNHMRGIRALQRHLGSQVQIAEVDLDNQFTLPRDQYDLAVFLGILYHLKNPFYVMEQLAKRARYAVVSTRVARYFPDDKPMPQGQPIAYLVGAEELNQDASNFWIFSHPALHRLFERSYWRILEYASIGDTKLSTPVDSRRDERVFCLLESRFGLANVELLHGWHPTETDGTRWTRKQFSARMNMTAHAGPDRVVMRIWAPEELLARLGPRTLEIAIDGVPAAPVFLDRPGLHEIVRRFRAGGKRHILLSCEIDQALVPDQRDERERGVVVVSLDCE